MGSWLSVIASNVIGGLVLLSFMQFIHDVTRELYSDMLAHTALVNLDNLVRLIEYDFLRIGIGVNDNQQAILLHADSTDLSYQLDGNNDGVLETMHYYLSDASAATMTDNPDDRILYCSVDGGPSQMVSAGITRFMIRYYDAAGNESADLEQIRLLEMNLALESEMLYDNERSRLVWQGKFTPPNLIPH